MALLWLYRIPTLPHSFNISTDDRLSHLVQFRYDLLGRGWAVGSPDYQRVCPCPVERW
jgi:hypothetical protein